MSNDQAHWGDPDKICILSVASRVTGEEVARKILQSFAGTRIFIPRVVSADHELASVVGLEAATRIAGEVGGIHVEVPSGHMASVMNAQRVIMWAKFAGLPGREIAGLAGRTERHVRHVVAQLRALGKLPAHTPKTRMELWLNHS